jgi:hypothetical protein
MTTIYVKWKLNYMKNMCNPLDKIFPTDFKANVSAKR